MARKIFTVTLPDGTVAKRTSASAEYAFAVVLAESREDRVERAERDLNRAARIVEEIRAAVGGEVTRTAKPWTFGGDYVRVYVGGEYVTAYVTGRDEDVDDEAAREALASRLADAEGRVVEYRARVEAAKATAPVEYAVLRWSRRADLAAKAVAGELAAHVRNGSTLSVVPVD